MLPASLAAHVDATFERPGAWREALAERLPSLVAQWDLRLGDVMTGGWNSVVLACAAPHGPAVLKVTLAAEAVSLEARALRHWGPDAAVRVLASDATRGALLLERLVPATQMPATAEALGTPVQALGALHAATSPIGFPTLAALYADAEPRLLAMWRKRNKPVAHEAALRAATSLREFAAAPVRGGCVLLHGDPVPANFLLGAAGYRAIDPRPRAGDPAYDAAFWALFSEEGRGVAAKARCLADLLDLDADRVLRWAWAMAIDRILQVAESPPHARLVERLTAFVAALP